MGGGLSQSHLEQRLVLSALGLWQNLTPGLPENDVGVAAQFAIPGKERETRHEDQKGKAISGYTEFKGSLSFKRPRLKRGQVKWCTLR